ncbi:uncharacterized protein LOC111519461 isoform X2 [Drosophila willistoni]|uniref:uncharacterized protein LOC111519461 isoform X2 n=1 Tax=Drosophila willistoni TaxID=7260 RepID=UPI001F080BA4|nr:uncharacterized protein LOC111519461 isoform X2 [Drosophila willistoni]
MKYKFVGLRLGMFNMYIPRIMTLRLEFSINFVNNPTNTDNITYQFKMEIPKQKIVETHKKEGKWSNTEKETYLNGSAGDSISHTDTEFFLEFVFNYKNSTIRVNRVVDGNEGKGYNHICEYDTLFDLFEIQAVQIWGDVKKILTFTMKYD